MKDEKAFSGFCISKALSVPAPMTTYKYLVSLLELFQEKYKEVSLIFTVSCP